MPDVPNLLLNVDSFRGCRPADMEIVCRYAEVRAVEPGAEIFREGEPAARLYVVAEGEVEARRGRGEQLAIVARYVAGDSFGDGELWSGAAREFGARAVGAVVLVAFPRRGLSAEQIEARHPETFAAVLWRSIACVASRIRSTNAVIATRTPWIRALESMLYNDALTGLANRLWLDERIRALAPGGAAVLIVLKPDAFKSVNDLHGHDEGDRVLRAAGVELRRLVPESAELARFAGDEFAVLADGLSLSEGRELAQHILRSLEAFTVRPGKARPLSLGFRAGLASRIEGGAPPLPLQERARANVMRARSERRELVDG